MIGEEFIHFVQAERVLNSEVPYRDFFQFITPGSIYLAALIFKIFGIKLTVIKIFIALIGSALVILTYLISTETINKPLLQVTPAVIVLFFSIPQAPLFYHHWNAELFILLAIFTGLKYISVNCLLYIFLSGVSSGLAFLFLQHKGILIFSAIVSFLIFNHFVNREKQLKPVILVSLGFFLTLLPFFLFLYHKGAMKQFFYDCFVWVREFYAPFNSLPEYLFFEKKLLSHYLQTEGLLPALIKTRNYLFSGYLPIFIILLGGINFLKNLKKPGVLLYIASLFLFISTLQRPDFINIIYISQPFFVLLVYFSHNLLIESKNKFKYLAGILIIALLTVNSIYGCINTLKESSLYEYRLKTSRGIINFKSKDDMERYSNIFSIIESDLKGKRIFIYNWSTFFYFFAGIKNFTSYDVFLPAYNTEAQVNDLIQQLKDNNIEYIIYDSMDLWIKKNGENSMYPEGYRRIDLKNKLNEYINTNYDVIDEIEGIKIMKMKGSR